MRTPIPHHPACERLERLKIVVVRSALRPWFSSRPGSPAVLYELETIELLDLPRIELKDGDTYKDSLSVSTGQKCTAILPILLLDSDTPLLVDQPEDNLVPLHLRDGCGEHSPNQAMPATTFCDAQSQLSPSWVTPSGCSCWTPTARPRKINEGTVDRATFLATAQNRAEPVSSSRSRSRRGGAPPLRIHHFEEESFYLFQRMLTIQSAGQTFQTSPGDFMHIPRGTVPMFKNDGTAAAQRNGFEFVPPA